MIAANNNLVIAGIGIAAALVLPVAVLALALCKAAKVGDEMLDVWADEPARTDRRHADRNRQVIEYVDKTNGELDEHVAQWERELDR